VNDAAVRVVDVAALPTEPVSPKPILNLILGAIFGVLLGLAAVFFRERFDHTVHTKEEVEGLSGGAVLALIPHIGEEARRKYFERWLGIKRNGTPMKNGFYEIAADSSRLLLSDPQSIAAEAFRKLRTNITFSRPDAPPRVLIFTSPAAGDGKSISVMNLAIALVQQGKRVVVVDADMRRGALHKMLNGVAAPGLSEILVGQSDLGSSVQHLEIQPFGTLDLLATGIFPPNPAELLAAPRFADVIDSLREAYDAVLVDSPPINVVTDAAIIGRQTDGAVLIARASKTTRTELRQAVDQLVQVQIPVTGLILNDYEPKRASAYGGGYYSDYSYEYRSRPTTS
jgi:capsular exopolysaccharide synthesis family protein